MSIILFLSFFPLLLSLSLGFNLSSQVIYHKQKAQHICQKYTLANQKYLKKNIKKLLKLNAKAKRLRAQLSFAKNALKVAVTSLLPTAVAGAQAFLSLTKAQQVFLSYSQKKILADSFNFSQKTKTQLKKKLNLVFKKKNIQNYYYTQMGLALYPKPAFSLTPNYYTIPGFNYVQRSYVTFRLNIKNLLPPLLQKILPNSKKFKIKCSSSLLKEKKLEVTLWKD